MTEGQADSSNWTFNHPPDEAVEAEYGPNSPFWRTSLGVSIANYGTTTTEPEPSILSPLRRRLENAPSNEEFFQEYIEHLHKHVEELKNVENSRTRSIYPLPSPLRTTPPGYHALSPPQVALLPESATENLVTQNQVHTLTPN